ncbi:MAG TPA: hypothetical protein VFK85_16740 [Anaeromyxobacteraceae bacterium]|nr:hypothetical protein [Anaeromyxobacteraceae bacterium]
MSLIDARLPSFRTSVLESTFNGWPATVSVLFERSNRSTEPWISDELEVEPVPVDAVAPEVPDEPPCDIVPELLPVLLLSLEVDGLVDEELVEDGLVLVEDGLLDEVLPIDPLRDSSVFPVEDERVVVVSLLCVVVLL